MNSEFDWHSLSQRTGWKRDWRRFLMSPSGLPTCTCTHTCAPTHMNIHLHGHISHIGMKRRKIKRISKRDLRNDAQSWPLASTWTWDTWAHMWTQCINDGGLAWSAGSPMGRVSNYFWLLYWTGSSRELRVVLLTLLPVVGPSECWKLACAVWIRHLCGNC